VKRAAFSARRSSRHLPSRRISPPGGAEYISLEEKERGRARTGIDGREQGGVSGRGWRAKDLYLFARLSEMKECLAREHPSLAVRCAVGLALVRWLYHVCMGARCAQASAMALVCSGKIPAVEILGFCALVDWVEGMGAGLASPVVSCRRLATGMGVLGHRRGRSLGLC
jgi:hypothetical protein